MVNSTIVNMISLPSFNDFNFDMIVLWLYYIIDINSSGNCRKENTEITDRESDYLYITTTLISQLSSSEIESSPSSAE